jgi:hypothetical protein
MYCHNCGKPNPAGGHYCHDCGAAFTEADFGGNDILRSAQDQSGSFCGECGARVPPDAAYCGSCGSPRQPAASATTWPRPPSGVPSSLGEGSSIPKWVYVVVGVFVALLLLVGAPSGHLPELIILLFFPALGLAVYGAARATIYVHRRLRERNGGDPS